MMPGNGRSAFDETPEQRHALYEELWEKGTLGFVFGNYPELLVNEEINLEVCAFLQGKIRGIVDDPETAEKLLPDHFYGTKRPILDDGYYATYNRENVSLVDLRQDPIEAMTATGVRTASGITRSTCSCSPRASTRSAARCSVSIPRVARASG